MDVIRASSLAHLSELISAHGGDPHQLLDRIGIDSATPGDFNRFISYTALAALIGTASDELALPDMGLRLSILQNVEMLGPIAVLARNAGTVETALLGVIKYLHVYSPAIRAELVVGGRESRFEFEIVLSRVSHRAQMVELSLGVIHGMFGLLTDASFRPNRILFQHSRMSPIDVYLDRFGCPVEFDATVNALGFPTLLLNRALADSDPQAYALAARYLGEAHRHLSIDEHVAELIAKLLPLGQATVVDVARILMMHPRGLQRRLAVIGTTFDTLLDERRQSVAIDMLAVPEVPLSVISAQLGYSEQSSLTRSCRRWFGKTPLAVRREACAQAARPRLL